MQEIGRAIDLWIGELARQRRTPRTRDKYRRHLNALADTLPPYTAVSEITPDQCRQYLDRWIDKGESTIGGVISCLRGFFEFQMREGHVDRPGPMVNIQRPRRKRYEDLDVVTISLDDASRMLDACETWQELLCIGVALHTGRRRAALNAARRRDVDFRDGTIKFVDKGDKVIVQPMPEELESIIRAADESGVWTSVNDYLIPSRRPSTVTRKLRKDSLIYDTVKIVAARAGVESHVHALRGAFAVAFDEAHPGLNRVLQDLMGHARPETTQVYLRRRNKAVGMEAVRDLRFGSTRFAAIEDDDPGFHREEDGPSETPSFADVLELRPIRDSNPCSDGSEDSSADGGDPRPSRRSPIEAKLDELSSRARRAGKRVR